MTVSSSLFQQQSYRDAWQSYVDGLENRRGAVLWDYVILTASNETQARAYRAQIEQRLSSGQLPAATHYAVLPDPDGRRVGSGGATLNALRHIHAEAGSFLAGRRWSSTPVETRSAFRSTPPAESCSPRYPGCCRTDGVPRCLTSSSSACRACLRA